MVSPAAEGNFTAVGTADHGRLAVPLLLVSSCLSVAPSALAVGAAALSAPADSRGGWVRAQARVRGMARVAAGTHVAPRAAARETTPPAG